MFDEKIVPINLWNVDDYFPSHQNVDNYIISPDTKYSLCFDAFGMDYAIIDSLIPMEFRETANVEAITESTKNLLITAKLDHRLGYGDSYEN